MNLVIKNVKNQNLLHIEENNKISTLKQQQVYFDD